MEIVLNSKFFSELSVEQLGDKAVELGFDGIDVCVRPGHPVNPDNVADTLPQAVKTWSGQGLTCPLATAATNAVDPHAPEMERIYAGCAEAGVPRLKTGFWQFKAGDDYWRLVDTARAGIEAFVALSEKSGVQTCYQTHSGACIGSNCAGLMHLIRGLPPQHIGAYPDFGHMALDGEDWEMGLAMISDYLSVAAVKDATYGPAQTEGGPAFTPRIVPAGKGCVDWRRCLSALRRLGFDGPLSVHTEYNFEQSIIRQVGYAETKPQDLEELARQDATYIRGVLAELD